MIITCLGHAKFLITLDNGYRIVTDPFDSSTGYPVKPTRANAVLVSHGHRDHCAVETIDGYECVIDRAGSSTLAPDVRVQAIEGFHDDAQGSKRGKTLMFRIEAEGLRIVHLGDLGTTLTAEQKAALTPVDLLMIPVGGYYTINPEQAKAIAAELNPTVILPMHYRTACNADWPISPVEEFTSLYAKSETLPLLRVEKADLRCQPHVAVLAAAL